MAEFGKIMKLEELPSSLRVFLRAEAMRHGTDPEVLLEEILAGGNPIPKHLSDLIREVWKARSKPTSSAE